MVNLTVPAALTGGATSETVSIPGRTVREAFENHSEEFGPALRDSVIDGNEIKEYINVYVNGEEVRHLDGLSTEIDDDDTIRVIPAASGGVSNTARSSRDTKTRVLE